MHHQQSMRNLHDAGPRADKRAKNGHLFMKAGGGLPGFRTWSKRYLVVTNRRLSVYKRRVDHPASPLLTIAIKEMDSVMFLPQRRFGARFDVETQKQTFSFDCATPEEAETWVRTIHALLTHRETSSQGVKTKQAGTAGERAHEDGAATSLPTESVLSGACKGVMEPVEGGHDVGHDDAIETARWDTELQRAFCEAGVGHGAMTEADVTDCLRAFPTDQSLLLLLFNSQHIIRGDLRSDPDLAKLDQGDANNSDIVDDDPWHRVSSSIGQTSVLKASLAPTSPSLPSSLTASYSQLSDLSRSSVSMSRPSSVLTPLSVPSTSELSMFDSVSPSMTAPSASLDSSLSPRGGGGGFWPGPVSESTGSSESNSSLKTTRSVTPEHTSRNPQQPKPESEEGQGGRDGSSTRASRDDEDEIPEQRGLSSESFAKMPVKGQDKQGRSTHDTVTVTDVAALPNRMERSISGLTMSLRQSPGCAHGACQKPALGESIYCQQHTKMTATKQRETTSHSHPRSSNQSSKASQGSMGALAVSPRQSSLLLEAASAAAKASSPRARQQDAPSQAPVSDLSSGWEIVIKEGSDNDSDDEYPVPFLTLGLEGHPSPQQASNRAILLVKLRLADLVQSGRLLHHLSSVLDYAPLGLHSMTVRLLWLAVSCSPTLGDARSRSEKLCQILSLRCQGANFTNPVRQALFALLFDGTATQTDNSSRDHRLALCVRPHVWSAICVCLPQTSCQLRNELLLTAAASANASLSNAKGFTPGGRWMNVFTTLSDIPRKKTTPQQEKVYVNFVQLTVAVHRQFCLHEVDPSVFRSVLVSFINALLSYTGHRCHTHSVISLCLSSLFIVLCEDIDCLVASAATEGHEYLNLLELLAVTNRFCLCTSFWDPGRDRYARLNTQRMPFLVHPRADADKRRKRKTKKRLFDMDVEIDPGHCGMHWTPAGQSADLSLAAAVFGFLCPLQQALARAKRPKHPNKRQANRLYKAAQHAKNKIERRQKHWGACRQLLAIMDRLKLEKSELSSRKVHEMMRRFARARPELQKNLLIDFGKVFAEPV